MGDDDARLSGTIKWFDADRGYGFIRRDDAELDLFVHITQIAGEGPSRILAQGDRVEFRIGDGKKGPEAMDVGRL